MTTRTLVRIVAFVPLALSMWAAFYQSGLPGQAALTFGLGAALLVVCVAFPPSRG